MMLISVRSKIGAPIHLCPSQEEPFYHVYKKHQSGFICALVDRHDFFSRSLSLSYQLALGPFFFW